MAGCRKIKVMFPKCCQSTIAGVHARLSVYVLDRTGKRDFWEQIFRGIHGQIVDLEF